MLGHQPNLIDGFPKATMKSDQPAKSWKTLFVIDTEPRSQGSLELQPFMEILTERGLAKPDHFLATAELGNEVAYGKGRTIVQKFSLR